MAKRIHRLSTAAVRNAKPSMHCDGGGLYLQASLGADKETVQKSWLFRYAINGRERQMGLGSLITVSLADARAKALECRKLLEDGTDPIAARDTARAAALAENAKAMTFDACRNEYIAAHRAGWRNPKHAAQWTSTLATYATPVFGKLSVAAIDTGLVMKVLDPLWKTKPETASRVRGRVESILDWAATRGFRTGENPARWKGHLDKLLPRRSKVRAVEHHAALAYGEIGAFMAELRQRHGVAARALELTILTAARSGEILGARWEEIDLQARVWTVPAGRMKSGREHRVPLSTAAVAVLNRLARVRESDQVFPGDQRAVLSNMAMLALLRRMGRGDLTVHGFRSSFRDWAAERTSFANEVVEMALAHAISDKVEAAYRRGDLFEKRRKLMDAWASYCAKPAVAGEVVPLRASS
jgi:integrase